MIYNALVLMLTFFSEFVAVIKVFINFPIVLKCNLATLFPLNSLGGPMQVMQLVQVIGLVPRWMPSFMCI